ncbi:U3 small nucleolar RNA-associated protein MPP10 [Colletotrichum sidae]|uniref:U3 small nucleolar ribonucleoprotein protein MPP10 n=1 Tax=Colletotrichum sidae TaxID=1347389 RepID=A0A4R8TQ26_9PEZI|nr:U3 small nucleolar RNA-associated protein MPP10 [Colletotrichum sidae]
MAAGSSSSSLTSTSQTSHTLTFAPGMAAHLPPMSGASAAQVRALFDNLGPANRHAFLQPPPAIPSASLQVVKDTLDAFAGQISDEQLRLLKEASKKRKRADGGDRTDVLKIRKVHVDGFETGQVWQQARRIIKSALKHSQETLQELEDRNEIVALGGEESLLESDEEGSEVDEEGSDDEEELSGSDLEASEEDDEEELEEGSDVEGLTGDLEDEDEDEDEDEEEEDDEDDDSAQELVEDPNGLNDGFFSIDDFNKQTQWFEEQDARGDPNTDVASDDEDIDWTADPLDPSKTAKSKKPRGDDDGEELEDEDDDEDGPTFGDMDLDAPEGASDDEDEDMDAAEEEEFNANGICYKDFFAPPAKKGSKDKKKKKSVSFAPKITDEDVERAMEDVKKDLFHDESDIGEDSDDALSDVSAGDPRSRRSAHERRQAKLSEEIRKLEAESVAKREWTLSGEASAVERPVNSLLEEDLAFEHLGKPVPVITAEVSESIDDLIKRRILAQDFDEVIRRRPGADVSENTRRGLVELDDSKSGKGLAEIYEEEHLKNTDPDNYVSKSDEKTQREEKEIEAMWKELSAKLDSLSSWYYKPKPAAPSLTVVSDAATIAMEDAQPATAQGVSGGQTMLAPQEVYKAGKDTAEQGEVVARNGLPTAKQEMTREEKLRRRRREKERIRKAGGLDATKKPLSKKAQQQKETVADLKKGGVKVINRKGEVVDVDGNKAKAAVKATSSSFKL